MINVKMLYFFMRKTNRFQEIVACFMTSKVKVKDHSVASGKNVLIRGEKSSLTVFMPK